MSHRRAIRVIAVAALLDVLGAVAFSIIEHVSLGIALYWAVATATTVGYGDVTPHTSAGRVISVGMMLTVIPLFAAAFSLVTSELGAVHVRRESERIRRHLHHITSFHPDIPDYEEEK